MAVFTSYDVKGNKLSFANWISNLSPIDTYFVSTTKKEQVKNKKFQWQYDSLVSADATNAQVEGADVGVITKRTPTKEKENLTQILRKAVEVTDTADATDNYGRQKELEYQMEKAGKEIKRDLEKIFLSDQEMLEGGSAQARKTACFQAQLASGKESTVADPDTTAVVFKNVAGSLTEKDLFDMTYNLYLAGSHANVIMYHPSYASFFSSLMESGTSRTKMIDNLETKLNKYVASLIDPLGQEFQLVPNRFMPKSAIYIFNPEDWTQMVLRAPERTKLAKLGSTEQYMIEMEVGLRHRHPYASAYIKVPVINP